MSCVVFALMLSACAPSPTAVQTLPATAEALRVRDNAQTGATAFHLDSNLYVVTPSSPGCIWVPSVEHVDTEAREIEVLLEMEVPEFCAASLHYETQRLEVGVGVTDEYTVQVHAFVEKAGSDSIPGDE